MKHTLKTHPAMFRACRDGVKPFEVRKDDRAFQTGDVVQLTYYDPDAGAFPAAPMPYDADDKREPLEFRVTFVLRGGQYGIEPGFVVLGLAPISPPSGVYVTIDDHGNRVELTERAAAALIKTSYSPGSKII